MAGVPDRDSASEVTRFGGSQLHFFTFAGRHSRRVKRLYEFFQVDLGLDLRSSRHCGIVSAHFAGSLVHPPRHYVAFLRIQVGAEETFELAQTLSAPGRSHSRLTAKNSHHFA